MELGAGAREVARRRVGAPVDQEAEAGRGVRAEGAVVGGVADADRADTADVDAVPDVGDGLPAGQRQPYGPAVEGGSAVVGHGDLDLEATTPHTGRPERRGTGRSEERRVGKGCRSG